MTGITTSSVTAAKANEMRLHRTHAGSCCGLTIRTAAAGRCCSRTASVLMASAPALEFVDYDQHDEGEDQENHRDCGRFAVGKFLKARDDENRRNLGFVRHIARDKDDRSVFSDAA